MQWILDNRTRPDGRPWKTKPLSLEAGLGGPHVGMIARGDITNVKTETIYAIARVARVSGAWLLTGKGSPDDVDGHQATDEDERPRWSEREDWPELLAAALLEEPSPAWVQEKVASMRYELRSEPRPHTLAVILKWVRENEWEMRPRARVETGSQLAATGTGSKK